MSAFSKKIERLRKRTDRALADYESACTAVVKEGLQLGAVRTELDALRRARDVAQLVAEAVQRDAHERVAGLVSRCLSAVFGEDAYRFAIEFEKKRNRTEARAAFVRDGQEIDPLTAAGGGVVDVAAFALRLSVLTLRHPLPRRLVVLDEPFKFVSEEYRPKVKELIEALSTELGFQFVVVTHLSDLEIGKVVRLEK